MRILIILLLLLVSCKTTEKVIHSKAVIKLTAERFYSIVGGNYRISSYNIDDKEFYDWIKDDTFRIRRTFNDQLPIVYGDISISEGIDSSTIGGYGTMGMLVTINIDSIVNKLSIVVGTNNGYYAVDYANDSSKANNFRLLADSTLILRGSIRDLLQPMLIGKEVIIFSKIK